DVRAAVLQEEMVEQRFSVRQLRRRRRQPSEHRSERSEQSNTARCARRGHKRMDFGVVLQTNPPAWRTVQLAELSEAHGFDYVWTFDSHLLWQEPYVIYSQILARTNRVMVGPMVTNPATRVWTVTASLFATLNEMFGNRTICGIGRGDSAVRVTNGRPTTVREMRDATHVIRELANCRPVDYKGSTLQFPWGATRAPAQW